MRPPPFHPGRTFQLFPPNARHYAAGRNEAIGDPKMDLIRSVLYPNNIRNKATPTGTWRPDVGRVLQRAIPSVQAHNTIERAWLLHQRHVRKKREAELARKFECMRKAMEVLEGIDSRLYTEANKQDDPRTTSEAERRFLQPLKGSELKALESRIPGLFPRELRIPTDTPPRNGWNYDWEPLSRPI